MWPKLTIDPDEYFAILGRKGPPNDEGDLMVELLKRNEPALSPNWNGDPTFSIAGWSLLDSEGDFVDFLDLSKKETFLYGQLVTWDRKGDRKRSVLIGGILVNNWLVLVNLISLIS